MKLVRPRFLLIGPCFLALTIGSIGYAGYVLYDKVLYRQTQDICILKVDGAQPKASVICDLSAPGEYSLWQHRKIEYEGESIDVEELPIGVSFKLKNLATGFTPTYGSNGGRFTMDSVGRHSMRIGVYSIDDAGEHELTVTTPVDKPVVIGIDDFQVKDMFWVIGQIGLLFILSFLFGGAALSFSILAFKFF